MHAKRGMPQRKMPSRGSSPKISTGNSVSYDCEYNGKHKALRLPSQCNTLEDFQKQLCILYQLRSFSVSLEFNTAQGTSVPITNNQEYQQYLPFMKKIILK